MIINITGGGPEDYWKRATVAAGLVLFKDVMPSPFREPARHMVGALLEYQLGMEAPDMAVALCEESTAKVQRLPGDPSFKHMIHTLHHEWGDQCMGRNFWIQLWKYRARNLLSRGTFVLVTDADSNEEREALHDICEYPIVIDATDQRFKEALSYTLRYDDATIGYDQQCVHLMVKELKDMFQEMMLKLA